MLRLLRAATSHYRRRRDPVSYARAIGVQVGERCRLYAITGATFGSEPFLVRLGDDVTVTAGVRFVTHDGGVDVLRDEFPDLELIAPVEVGDRVFLGLNSIVLPGVRIGPRSVVGAGSVVTRDVAGGTVVAGVPARPVCSVERYREKALADGLRTRGVRPAAKRAAIETLLQERAGGAAEPRGRTSP